MQETKKQRDSNIEKYAGVLDKIQNLKKLLKTEIEQTKKYRRVIQSSNRVKSRRKAKFFYGAVLEQTPFNERNS